jgi:hypothetical protein
VSGGWPSADWLPRVSARSLPIEWLCALILPRRVRMPKWRRLLRVCVMELNIASSLVTKRQVSEFPVLHSKSTFQCKFYISNSVCPRKFMPHLLRASFHTTAYTLPKVATAHHPPHLLTPPTAHASHSPPQTRATLTAHRAALGVFVTLARLVKNTQRAVHSAPSCFL